MKKQLWKMPIDVRGKRESFTLPLLSKGVLDLIPLKHTYFTEIDLKIEDDKGMAYVVAYSDPKADFILTGLDETLTKIVGKRVFNKLKIASERPLNKTLIITATYIGDILDPSSFNQELHQSADVAHRSIETFETSSAINNSAYSEVLYCLSLPDGGQISNTINELKLPELKVLDTIISQTGLKVKGEVIELSNDKSSLTFNGKYWETKTLNAKAKVLSLLNIDKAIHCGIPIYNKFDCNEYTFADWLTVDAKSKTLKTQNVEVQGTVSLNKIKIGEYTIEVNAQGDLVIAGVLAIKKGTKKIVTYGAVNKDAISEITS